MRRWLLVLALVVTPPVWAQAPPPALTALEQTQMENLWLRVRVAQLQADVMRCEATLAPTKAKAASQALNDLLAQLVKDIEANHPGFTFSATTGQFTAKEPQ